jgi:tape measure domain-containing protein
VSVVANVAINVDSRNAVSKLRQVQGQAQQTERAFGGIATAVAKLAVAFAGIQAIKFVFTQAAELQTQARSLEILAGSAEKAGKIIKELQELGAVTPFTSTELIDSAKRLQAFGVETDKVVETTRRLADASGATGAELSGLVTAFGQVQAKGRLQGEELLQFQERGIALQEELRKMYGMTGEEFQKALSKGQIGAEAVEVALINLTNVGGKYANGAIAQSDTLNGKLSTLQDSFQRLAQNIGKFFEPIFKFLIDGINAFLDRVNNGLNAAAQLKVNKQAAVQTREKFGAFRAANPFDQEAQQFEENLRKSLLKSALRPGKSEAPKAPSAAPAVPSLLSATSGKGAGKGKTDAERAAEEKRRAAEELANLQGQVTLKEKLFGIDKQIAVEKERGSLVTAAALEMDKALEERQSRIAEITRSTADTATKNAQIKDATLDADQKIYAVQQAIKEQEAERIKSFDAIIADLNLELALKTATTEQAREQLRIAAERAKLEAKS